jgi:hypothetical protein
MWRHLHWCADEQGHEGRRPPERLDDRARQHFAERTEVNLLVNNGFVP